MIVTISQVEKVTKPFWLFNSCSEDPTYVELVKTGLSKQVRGTSLFKLQHKLKQVKTLSKQWAMEKGNYT